VPDRELRFWLKGGTTYQTATPILQCSNFKKEHHHSRKRAKIAFKDRENGGTLPKQNEKENSILGFLLNGKQ
jgi:hypothetical protein